MLSHPWIGPKCLCGAVKPENGAFCPNHWRKLKVADIAGFAERICRDDTTNEEWQSWYQDVLDNRLKRIIKKES